MSDYQKQTSGRGKWEEAVSEAKRRISVLKTFEICGIVEWNFQSRRNGGRENVARRANENLPKNQGGLNE